MIQPRPTAQSSPPLFKVVAHRGDTPRAPENTIAAYRSAVELGADAIEMDVRLTRDGVPVVYHYFYLHEVTTGTGPIFGLTSSDLRRIRVLGRDGARHGIPTLDEVLSQFAGQIAFEVEVKGPEPEASSAIGAVLRRYQRFADSIEVTSYEPALLREVRRLCPSVSTALLFPQSEPWMGLDVVGYAAAQRARLAHARAVHLHPKQLNSEVVAGIRTHDVEVHAWDVNDEGSLQLALDLGLPWICTDKTAEALAFRTRIERDAGAASGQE